MSIYDINGKKLVTNDKHYPTFSVLSDSFSAYNGFVEPEDNAVWFPNDYVTSVEEMWWHLFAKSYDSVLQMNNSYSGSRIANDPYWSAGDDTKTFIGRMNNIGKPSLLFILGGTNDVWNGVSLGEYIYSDWTEEDLQTFRPALSYMLDYLQKRNVGMKIVFLLNTQASASTDEYDDSIKTVCEYYGVDVIELSGVQLLGNHPSLEGMKQIRNKLMDYFEVKPSVVNEITSGLTFPYTASTSLNRTDLSEELVQYKLYKFVLDGVISDGACFQIRMNSNTVMAEFSSGQNGTEEIIVQASQYDVGSSMILRCTSGTGTVNSLKIYEVSYDE